jgi:Large eukaryotic DNA virus major capsid protein
MDSFFDPPKQSTHTFTTQTLILPFDTAVGFGTNPICTISKSGQTIKDITLKTTLGPLYSVPSNGYVFPTIPSDTDIYDIYGGNPVGRGSGNVQFYNTQTLLLWFISLIDIVVSFDGTRFQFRNVDGVGFASEVSAQFWGFNIALCDAIINHKYIFYSTTSQLSLVQSGWNVGFTPTPPGYGYVDSVGQVLVKNATLTFGRQHIESTMSDILITQDDLEVPLENQAALTLLVGKNDNTTPIQNRIYYTKLNFDTIPLSTLYNSTVQLQVNFDTFSKVSKVPQTNGITDPNSYNFTAIGGHAGTRQVLYWNDYIIIQRYADGVLLIFNIYTYEHIFWAPDTQNINMLVLVGDLIYSYNGNVLIYVNINDVINTYVYDWTISSFDWGNANRTISSENEGIHSLNVSGYDIIMSYFLNQDIYWVIYNTRSDIDEPYSYTSSLVSFKEFFSISDDVTTTNDGVGVFTDGLTYYIYVFGELYSLVDPQNTTYGIGTIPLPFGRVYNTSVFDGTYFYFGSAEGMMKFDGSNFIVYTYPGKPLCYDGSYVYFIDSSTLYSYNIFSEFDQDSAWTIVNNLGVLLNKPDYFFYTSGIVAGPRFNYLTTDGGIYQFDPVPIIPFIQSEVMIEYVDYNVYPQLQYTNLIKQNDLNTFIIQPNTTTSRYNIVFNDPVREFWIESDAHINRITLELNGYVLFDESYTSLFVIRPFQYHTTTPSKTTGVYSFALDPEKLSGVLNISRFGSVIITVYNTKSTSSQSINIYSRSYNLLHCSGGIGALVYN